MPAWWRKFSSKEDKRKASKVSFIDGINRKLKITSEEKSTSRSGGSRRGRSDTVSERGSLSQVPSRSPSPSTQVPRCQSFAERPHAQSLPLSVVHHAHVAHTNSGINASTRPGFDRGSSPSLFLPMPKPGQVSNKLDPVDAEGDIGTASISSDSFIDSDDPSDSRLLSPLTSDYENGRRTATNSPSGIKHKDQFHVVNQKNSKEIPKPAIISFNYQHVSTLPKQGPLGNHVQNLQIRQHGAFSSATDSSKSSPSRSPVRAFCQEHVWNCGPCTGKPISDIAFLGSGHCSSPGSGQNSVAGDMSGQLFWPQSRCSPECSPIPSPRMTSPGPSSRIHSGTVTPLRPRAADTATESPTSRPDDGKQQSHRLPLPPITVSNTCPFSPAYSAATSPSLPRSPGKAENPTSSGSCWKKGRLLGRGTFGHVYLGFNSESGEMCAMKEVTLFSDDAKSKETAQQFGQEIMLLSRLQHPNIVQYYGYETVDDKLYIYLEYVSGGSIHKLLQEYGQFGENAIRNYTQQILSGLAYLHAKNTVHRDIKGANILVDPNSRVKLADFGMAKHITGSSCPLSLKGSPYWMAPEVMKNSNGCNLAVDIWSLGCTVLEMATTKPPWSQYEGAAAMFKIGYSKDLPAIPNSLSDEGKDFVRQCLQRNPLHRPTAAQLLEHAFVKKPAPEKPIISADALNPSPAATNVMRTLGIGNTRNLSGTDSEGMAGLPYRGLETGSVSSDPRTPRNVSRPVSPNGSPLPHPRSPQHMSGRMSPSPISSPHTASGSSTPLNGGSDAIPFHHQKQSMTYLHESIGMIPRSQNSFYGNASNPYQEPKPDLFQGISQASTVFQEMISPDSGASEKQYRWPGHRDRRELYDGQPVLADHMSQQLLRDHVKSKLSLDLNPSSSMLGHNRGI